MSETDTSQTNDEAPQPGSEEYNQQMADKFRNQGQTSDPNVDSPPAAEVSPMPEGGHEKYYNKETGAYDWQSHAKELQYNLERAKGNTQGDAKTPENTDGDGNQDSQSGDADSAVQDVVTKAGLSMEDLQNQIASEGKLTDDARTALVKQGIPEALIDSYVQYAKVAAETTRASALDYAGGEENWNQMTDWARQNMSQSEVTRINSLLASEDWKLGIDAIRQRMGSSRKTAGEGALNTGESRSQNAPGYRSKAQMIQDMRDPRYQNDPAFRQEVMAKIKHANFQQ